MLLAARKFGVRSDLNTLPGLKDSSDSHINVLVDNSSLCYFSVSNDVYGKMGELQDEDYRLPLNENNLIDHDKFLDLTSLTDADDFEDCASWIQEDEEKEKVIERLIESQSGSNLFRDICFSRGGLLNGISNLFF